MKNVSFQLIIYCRCQRRDAGRNTNEWRFEGLRGELELHSAFASDIELERVRHRAPIQCLESSLHQFGQILESPDVQSRGIETALAQQRAELQDRIPQPDTEEDHRDSLAFRHALRQTHALRRQPVLQESAGFLARIHARVN